MIIRSPPYRIERHAGELYPGGRARRRSRLFWFRRRFVDALHWYDLGLMGAA